MDPDGRERLDRLNDTLNSRTRYKSPLDKRSPVKEIEAVNVQEKWQGPELDEMLSHERVVPPVNPFMKKVFVFSFLFFLAALFVAGTVFFGGVNFISSKNVDINVLGPTVVSAGETLELGVSISNTNNADLETATLSIQYPTGSRNAENTAEPISYSKHDLGVIDAGDEAVQNVSVVLLGLRGEIKEIKFSLEYKFKGSNATFYKEKVFEVAIGNAPITLSIKTPDAITSGETFNTQISVTLNSQEVLKNVILKAEYPHGYTVADANPKPTGDDNVWILGDLSPGDKKTISINGKLLGENLEERTFRYYAGVSDSAQNPNLKVTIASFMNSLAISRPSVGLDVTFNGENISPYIAPAGRVISSTIKFKNNLDDRLLDPRLEIAFSGTALDKNTVSPGNGGTYDSGTGKITWSLTSLLGNRELGPGEGGTVTLRFASLPSSGAPEGNQDIVLNVTLTGVPSSAVAEKPIAITEVRTVRISSQINFNAKMVRSLGPFINSGPIPPKVGQETTYTAVLSVGNTRGDIGNAQVTAKLGPGVKWIGAQSFISENVSYDESSNTVTWNMGMLSSGSGFSTATREVSFQVGLTPTVSQIGTAPTLVNNTVFTGNDQSQSSNNLITVTSPNLTTRLTTDPAFIQGDDIVVK